jgi:hypothetical protein
MADVKQALLTGRKAAFAHSPVKTDEAEAVLAREGAESVNAMIDPNDSPVFVVGERGIPGPIADELPARASDEPAVRLAQTAQGRVARDSIGVPRVHEPRKNGDLLWGEPCDDRMHEHEESVGPGPSHLSAGGCAGT